MKVSLICVFGIALFVGFGEGAGCYASDLAAVDGLGVSRATAERIANKHLGWW